MSQVVVVTSLRGTQKRILRRIKRTLQGAQWPSTPIVSVCPGNGGIVIDEPHYCRVGDDYIKGDDWVRLKDGRLAYVVEPFRGGRDVGVQIHPFRSKGRGKYRRVVRPEDIECVLTEMEVIAEAAR